MNPKDVVSYIEGELFISVVPVGKTVMVSSAGEAAVSGVSLVDTVFQLGISYIIAGKDSLDYEQALTKLKEQFGAMIVFFTVKIYPKNLYTHLQQTVDGSGTRLRILRMPARLQGFMQV